MANNNKRLLDIPLWHQVTAAPAATGLCTCCVDDGVRYIYVLFSATAFWRYDSWANTWSQLASPTATGFLAGTCMRYVTQMGGQTANNGVTEVFGSIYAFQCTGAAVTLYRYDIATNSWGAALSVANLPAAFAVNGHLLCPEPALNGFQGGYHSALALNTITASATAAQGATTISVAALPLALPAGAVLNFGTATAPVWAVLTASAAAAATSITVAALGASVPSASVAYFYADMFLAGSNATQLYRYNIAGNTWSTTNAAGAALPAVSGALGAGCVLAWLPGSGDANALNCILIVRGTATSNIYEYDLATNTMSAVTYYPQTETFSSGSSSGIRSNSAGKSERLLLQKDNTCRISQYDHKRRRMELQSTQDIFASGTTVLGDKMAVIKDPTGEFEFIYSLVHTSSNFARSPINGSW